MSGNEELELRSRETELDEKENRLDEIQKQLRKKLMRSNKKKKFI
ncbi:hypothetical protein HpCK35_24290 [Helicobacter pylori]